MTFNWMTIVFELIRHFAPSLTDKDIRKYRLTPNTPIHRNTDILRCLFKAINVSDLAHGQFPMQIVKSTGKFPVFI